MTDIFGSMDSWIKEQPWPKKPNQCDSKYYVIDIGCSTDVPLMQKYYDWQMVFDYFNIWTVKAKSSFATKYPTMFDPKKYKLLQDRHRIRVSLMPQKYANVLEPNTDSISDRIKHIAYLQEHMEVHINFSPIIYADDWLTEYRLLFHELRTAGVDVKSECIFLTYNQVSHERASKPVNDLLWRPEIQERKDSQYAPDNIRYKSQLKKKMVQEFTALYSEFFNPGNIRYIF